MTVAVNRGATRSLFRTFQIEGLVLRRYRLEDKKVIVVLITPQRGLLRAVIRVGQRVKSGPGALLDLLCYANLTVVSGRNLHYITEASVMDSFGHYAADYGKFTRAMYLAELAERLSSEEQPNQRLFELLLQALNLLDGTTRPGLLCSWFEINALGACGYMPQIQHCAVCDKALTPVAHLFIPSSGGVVHKGCLERLPGHEPQYDISVNAVKLLRFLARSSWDKLEGLKMDEQTPRLIRTLLRSYMRQSLDINPRSAAMLDSTG